MPVSVSGSSSGDEVDKGFTSLPFPPIARSHILHCSYHYWHPKYRSVTPKARLIPLSQEFVKYLKADGIYLPLNDVPEDDQQDWSLTDNTSLSQGENLQDGQQGEDPSRFWQDIHASVKLNIDELGGKVAPKLNWSAPKDAVWINATNSMECRSPNDVYTLLKASDFITHDLEHLFDGCTAPSQVEATIPVPYHLVLRKYVDINPAVEFRCFVRRRQFLGACQRDLNHFDFLVPMRESLLNSMQEFYAMNLQSTFPDENFVFDVYIPAQHQRVWLIDINPWAPRTDPILFSWMELLTMPDFATCKLEEKTDKRVIRLFSSRSEVPSTLTNILCNTGSSQQEPQTAAQVELRLIRKDDPKAHCFNTTQYSAHKLPKDVVDATRSGLGGLKEFAAQWKEIFDQHDGR